MPNTSKVPDVEEVVVEYRAASYHRALKGHPSFNDRNGDQQNNACLLLSAGKQDVVCWLEMFTRINTKLCSGDPQDAAHGRVTIGVSLRGHHGQSAPGKPARVIMFWLLPNRRAADKLTSMTMKRLRVTTCVDIN